MNVSALVENVSRRNSVVCLIYHNVTQIANSPFLLQTLRKMLPGECTPFGRELKEEFWH